MGSTMLMGKGLQRFVLFHIFTTKLPPAIILSGTLYQEAIRTFWQFRPRFGHFQSRFTSRDCTEHLYQCRIKRNRHYQDKQICDWLDGAKLFLRSWQFRLLKKFCAFWKLEVSLLCSQQSATCPVRSQINPAHTLSSNLCTVSLLLFSPSHMGLSSGFSFGVLHQNHLCSSSPPCATYVERSRNRGAVFCILQQLPPC